MKARVQSKEETKRKTEPETMPQDEKDFYNCIIYGLFEEYVKGLSKQTEAEKEEELSVLAHFAEIQGVKVNSPYYMLYMGFRAGVDKGLELAQRLESRV